MFTKSEAKQIRLEFWGKFRQISSLERRQRGLKKDWMLKRTGIKEVSLRFDANRQHTAVGFEIFSKDKFTEALFVEKFESLKQVLSDRIDLPIVWDDNFVTQEGRSCTRIYVDLNHVDIYCQNDWERMYEFMLKYMFLFEEIFVEFKEFIADIKSN
jgi:hypothetical protein